MLARLEHGLERWLHARRLRRLMRACGGIQWCPWCKQCAQSGEGRWGFRASKEQPLYDVLTCGVCGGTSLWLWGMGMHYQRRLEPGPACWPTGLAEHPVLQNGASAHG